MRAFDEGNLRSSQDKTPQKEFVTGDYTDWARLGFSKPAFEDNVDDSFFAITSWQDLFKEMAIFADGQDPLLVIPSITGSGKTTFLAQFMARQKNPLCSHYLKARSIFSLRHLLNAVSENFSDFRNVSANTEQFFSELRSAAREVGPQLLIIDDAQRLSKETLAGLLKIAAAQDLSSLWLRIVLCGEPQLEDRVQSLFDELELAFTFPAITLEAMSFNETRAYLKHRLDDAGYTHAFPFNKSTVKHIHTLSGGFPGRVNRVAQQVLIDKVKQQQLVKGGVGAYVRSGLANHKVKLISFLLLSIAGGTFWHLQHAPSKVALAPMSLPIATNVSQPSLRIKKQPALPLPTKTAVVFDHQTSKPVEPVVLKSQPMMLPPIHALVQKPADLSWIQQQKLSTQPRPASAIPSLSLPKKIPTIAKHEVEKKSETIKALPSVSLSQSKPQPKTISIAKAKPTQKAPATIAYSNKAFTVQLMGVHDKQKLIAFAKDHHLGKDAAYFQSTFKGKPWYVLIYGNFTTPEQAHAAVAKLPQFLQQRHPWVKPLSTVNSHIYQLDTA